MYNQLTIHQYTDSQPEVYVSQGYVCSYQVARVAKIEIIIWIKLYVHMLAVIHEQKLCRK